LLANIAKGLAAGIEYGEGDGFGFSRAGYPRQEQQEQEAAGQ
jgi:hypothetical protein